MKIEEQVLSREQMAHLEELGVDTSDASMCWIKFANSEINEYHLDIYDGTSYKEMKTPGNIVRSVVLTYTIGDLIEKLPKEIAFTFSCASYKYERNGFSPEIRYQILHTHDSNLKEDLYNALCFVAENHKELIK